MPTPQEWAQTIGPRRAAGAEIRLAVVLERARPGAGGSLAFLALGSDGERYYAKVLNNPQGPRVPLTEQIVGRAGLLLGAPVCPVRTMEIGAQFVGQQFATGGQTLQAGIAHASAEIPGALEVRGALQYQTDDDNPRRQAFIVVLHDWCWGDDVQWMREAGQENRFHSHDHGHFLPPGGNQWTSQTLMLNTLAPHAFAGVCNGLSAGALAEAAVRLEALTQGDIVEALAGIPAGWVATDEELGHVAYYLFERAGPVAARVRARIP